MYFCMYYNNDNIFIILYHLIFQGALAFSLVPVIEEDIMPDQIYASALGKII